MSSISEAELNKLRDEDKLDKLVEMKAPKDIKIKFTITPEQ